MSRKAMLALVTLLLTCPASALAAAGGTDRPVAGTATGTGSIDLPNQTYVFDATGTVSHMGRSTLHSAGTQVLTGGGTVILDGPLTVTSASGDQLVGSLDGIGGAEFDLRINVGATFTVTGGTGRFSGATGSLTTFIHEQPLTLPNDIIPIATDFRFAGSLSH